MKNKFTHKFIIFNEKKIKENSTDLAELEDTIPQDYREKACEISEDFEKRRKEFLSINKSEMWAVEEILPIVLRNKPCSQSGHCICAQISPVQEFCCRMRLL